MSNGSPPTTIEGYPRLSTGRVGLVPPNIAAHIYTPVAPSSLVPALIEDVLENFPVFATNGVGVAQDAGIWIYQPNVPYGMIEIIPSLQPPSNIILPVITWVGGPANTVGSTAASNAGSWTPTTPTPTYVRQWYSSGVAIPGATAISYVAQISDVGNFLTCRVTATNPAGSTSVTTLPTGPIIEPAGAETQPTQQPQSRAAPKYGKTAHHASPVHRRSSGSSQR